MADTYAIVESGGKQYRAEKGATLLVDRLPADEGAKVGLRAVMFRGDGDVVLDADKLEKVKVEALVAGHERGKKIRVFKYRAKKGYRKRAGHRSELTRLEVTDVKLLTRKPVAKAEPKAQAATAEKPKAEASEATKPAAKAAAARAPTAKKPAAKASTSKPAPKAPTAKKPAARKPAATASTAKAAKKPAARRTSTPKKES
jgi:large subunit ribosomal protein L21